MNRSCSDKRRVLSFIIASVMIIVVLCLFTVSSFSRENKIDAANERNEAILDEIYQSYFPKVSQVVQLLAQDESVIKSLEQIGQTNDALKVKLNTIQSTYDLEMCYIMNEEGTVVAASRNVLDAQLDIVGRNFSFRPYFLDALQGMDVIYPALSSVTNERGIYFSSPIRNSSGKIIGVAICTMQMSVFDNVLEQYPTISAVITHQDIVISSNQLDWLYKLFSPKTSEEIAQLRETRQFMDTELQPLEILMNGTDSVTVNGAQYYISQRDITDTGWYLVSLYEYGQFPILKSTQLTIIIVLFTFLIVLTVSVIVIIYNVMKRRAAEETHKKLFVAVQQSSSSILITDANGILEYVNPAFLAITGYDKQECIGQNMHFLRSGMHDQSFYDDMWNAIKTGEDWHGTFCSRKKNGELYWEDTLISSVKDQRENITHYIAIKEDITKRKELEDSLKKYATIDEMTETLNRRSGMLLIERQIQTANEKGLSFSVIFMDINGLKSVNDSLGHSYGDELITTAVRVLKSNLRESDAVCRLGGDEFLIILGMATTADMQTVLQRILHKADEVNNVENHPFILSLSFGIAEYHAGSELSVDDLIRIADENMYRNKVEIKKKQGPNGVLKQLELNQ